MLHVFFTRPEQLDRRARNLFCDRNGLFDKIMESSAPAETTAKMNLVDFALRGRQPGRLGRGLKRSLAILRRAPDLTAFFGPERSRIHRLHRCVILVGIRVRHLDGFLCILQRRLHITRLVSDEGLFRIEALIEHLRNRFAADPSVWPIIPVDRQRVQRAIGLPPGFGDHRDRVVFDRHDCLHAGHGANLVRIE